MNLTIHPAAAKLLDYRVELITSPQPFYHTATQLTGSFGRIVLTKIDLRNCTIWTAEYTITEEITLHGFVNELLFQIYFPVPVQMEFTAGQEILEEPKEYIHLSATNTHTVSLSPLHSRMLFIHYTKAYFNGNGTGRHENLMEMFTPHPAPPNSLKVNDAIQSVTRQIINASPANRIIHLYLEAKAKELLSLLYQVANPETDIASISEKEIAALQLVKKIIMEDLSKSYNAYELSRMAGTNAYTLKINFRHWFGIPLHHFLHNCRMEKATQLLLTTALSVKEIAFTVGYKNVSNFSESFKNYYGYPPSKLRELD